MHATAAARGGRCLSTDYRNNSIKLRWCCANGHEWMATPGHVRAGRWCPECKRQRSGASQRLSIQHAHQLAENLGGKCLALVYKNASTPMAWQCSKGHKWSANYNTIQQGHWCRLAGQAAARLIRIRVRHHKWSGMLLAAMIEKWDGHRLRLVSFSNSL
jgi:hypothetical protein